MANKTVNLVILAKTEAGTWSRYPVVTANNKKLRRGFGVVNGNKVHFAQYTYQLRWYEGKRLMYKTLGRDTANAAATLKTAAAKAEGVNVVEDEPDRRAFVKAAKAFVVRAEKKGKFVAATKYERTLTEFREAVPSLVFVDQIREDVVLTYIAKLRNLGYADQSIANRWANMKTFLKWIGWSAEQIKKVLGGMPKVDKREPVAYSLDELSTLFATAEQENDDRYMYTVLRLLQMTGLRKAEAAHLMWHDVDFKRGEIKVTAKPHCRCSVECQRGNRGFRLKDREERRVPMPERLAEILRERKAKVPAEHLLVVGGPEDKPCTTWLRQLQLLARKAGLACGQCDGCRVYTQSRSIRKKGSRADPLPKAMCGYWGLHSFRRSYASHLHRKGYAVRDIMTLLGHTNVETTMRYLTASSLESHKLTMRSISWE
jgi:integrase